MTQDIKQLAEVTAIDFARFLEEQTKVIYEDKITLYRYDGSEGVGNYTLDDIYTVYKEKYGADSAAPSQSVECYLPVSEAFWKELRDRFFKECTDFETGLHPIVKVNMAPHDLFKWFREAIQASLRDEGNGNEAILEKHINKAYLEATGLREQILAAMREAIENNISKQL